jgi:hypothetical protein
VVGVTPLPAVVQTPPPAAISYPISPDVSVEPPDPAVNDLATDAVTGDSNPPQTGDPVVSASDRVSRIARTRRQSRPAPPRPERTPEAPRARSGSPPERGVGPKHAPGDPTVPLPPPTASPVAQLPLACRRSNADERSLDAACQDSPTSAASAELSSSAYDPASGDARRVTDREGDPPTAAHAVVKRDGDALPGGGVK